jgi:hypothetical protein
MADHKKTHCKRGHELTGHNVVTNSEGFRECRTCKYARQNIKRRFARYELAMQRKTHAD